jgi:hypothetical protein
MNTPAEVEAALSIQGYPPVLRVRQARLLLSRYGITLPFERRRDIPLAEVAQSLCGLLNNEGTRE